MTPSRLLSLFLLLCAVSIELAQAQAPTPLAPNQRVERELPAGSTHTFALDLDANRFVYGAVNQISTDVVVTVTGPDGEQVGSFDQPARGPEPFTFTTTQAGAYRIAVRPFLEDETGRYAVLIERVEPVASTPSGRIDQLMAAYDREGSPGAAVAVVQDGRVVHARGYGKATLEYDVPITPATVFHVASVSKQFTAFGIVLLAQQGRLSLDDDIRTHLPEAPDFGSTITIRHLIHHTSGLRDQWNLLAMAGWRLDDVITKAHVFKLVERQQELNFEPGAEMLYCNTGYTLLAEIVERVSEMPFRDFMDEQVFAPLGMTHTLFYDDHERIVENRAYSYKNGPEGGFKKSVLSFANAGATSLFTTVEDMAHWIANFDDAQVGGKEALDQMVERGVLTDGDTLGYAFGLGVDTYRGHRRIGHGGADAGYRSYIGYFPDLKLGVVVLSNLASSNPTSIAMMAANLYLTEGTASSTPPSPPAPAPESPDEPWTPTAEELTEYAGRYFSPELETVYTLKVEEGTLVAEHTRHPDIALKPANRNDRFESGVWFFSNVEMERDDTGQISGLRVSNGRVRRLLFEKQTN